jgi:hypothetical protein
MICSRLALLRRVAKTRSQSAVATGQLLIARQKADGSGRKRVKLGAYSHKRSRRAIEFNRPCLADSAGRGGPPNRPHHARLDLFLITAIP